MARGSERLRLVPTAHHTPHLMDFFVRSISTVWREFRLPMFRHIHPKSCENCRRDLSLQKLYGPDPICDRSNCTYQSMQAALAWGPLIWPKNSYLNLIVGAFWGIVLLLVFYCVSLWAWCFLICYRYLYIIGLWAFSSCTVIIYYIYICIILHELFLQ